MTWALILLKAQPFSQDTIKKVNKISEERNSYVHYKWHSASEDKKNELYQVVQIAEEVVLELSVYEDQYLYRGAREKIEEIFKDWLKI